VSRQFDTSGGADSITFSAGGAAPDQGPITIAVLAKSFSVAGFTMWMARGTKTGTAIWGMLTSNNSGPKIFAENDFGNGVAGLSTSWRWYVMTKASGSALPRIHGATSLAALEPGGEGAALEALEKSLEYAARLCVGARRRLVRKTA